MDNEKKLSFLQNMTHMALSHTAKIANVPTPDGKMSHDKMLGFVHKVAKDGLEHFDNGGIANALGAGNSYEATNAPTSDQLNQAATGVNNSINQQQGFADQATGQNGFSNQTSVFNQQQQLANQLQAQANGTGPNPAQAQLNQATGQNIAQQAALMAGQRGAGANAGLAARQSAQQGAATQQTAVGQAATLEAQQQIAAESALQAQQSNLQGVAANQVATQGAADTAVAGSNLTNQSQLQAANANANSVNAGVAAGNQKANAGIIGGIAGSAGTALAGIGLAKGGMAGKDGIPLPDHLMKLHGIAYKGMSPLNEKSGGMIPGKSPVAHDTIKNDTVPAMLSKGEMVIDLDTMNDPGPMGKMARALAAHMKKKNGGKK